VCRDGVVAWPGFWDRGPGLKNSSAERAKPPWVTLLARRRRLREGKITLPVVLAFRRGSDAEREFWRRTLERGEAGEADLEHAIGLMVKHRALEDTIGRAHH
jgi:hypothetical protein